MRLTARWTPAPTCTCWKARTICGCTSFSRRSCWGCRQRQGWPQPLAAVRAAQAARLVELAAAVDENPADGESAGLLAVYPLQPATWDALGQSIGIADGETVGRALYQIGRFVDALPWFQRAVAAKEQPDAEGRVDHASLGESLHQSRLLRSSRAGRLRRRLPGYLERAAAEQASRATSTAGGPRRAWARSLHQVGDCLSSRATTPPPAPSSSAPPPRREQGDVHGRVDHESLGTSLHQVGVLPVRAGRLRRRPPLLRARRRRSRAGRRPRPRGPREPGHEPAPGRLLPARAGRLRRRPPLLRARRRRSRAGRRPRPRGPRQPGPEPAPGRLLPVEQGDYAAARPFFERAAAETEQGDVHGRVNHASLGASLHRSGTASDMEAALRGRGLPWNAQARRSRGPANRRDAGRQRRQGKSRRQPEKRRGEAATARWAGDERWQTARDGAPARRRALGREAATSTPVSTQPGRARGSPRRQCVTMSGRAYVPALNLRFRPMRA